MKKNKGFTLIELLAVLVILAIIALIITPIVTNLIKDARIKSAENACEGLLDAVEVYYGREMLKTNGVFNGNTTVTVKFNGAEGGVSSPVVDGDKAIEFNGFKVTGGSLTVDRNGKIVIDTNDQLRINSYYCVNKDGVVECDENKVS